MRYPIPLKLHKKSSQLQLDLFKPSYEAGDQNKKPKINKGAVMLSMALPLNDGTDRMDWKNKVTMSLSVKDIADIISGVRSRENVKLYHNFEATNSVTTLNVELGNPGTYKWFMTKTVNGDKRMASIYLNKSEMFQAFTLLEAAIPLILGWGENNEMPAQLTTK